MANLWSEEEDDVPSDLLARLDRKFKPVWEGRPRREQVALARYFLPHKSTQAVIVPTRPRILKWYCPFACQSTFPSGHRYCINVYTGCAHRCVYCYAAAYEPEACAAKRDFRKLLDRDLADLEQFDVPPAPVHLSNSTDAFQPLEEKTGHTQYALERILAHRGRFTTVTIITKNPLLAAEPRYLVVLKGLRDAPAGHPQGSEFALRSHSGLRVEVSLAFWREEARAFYDPGAPTIAQRIEGLRALHAAGIPLRLRIDPLFPRSPLPTAGGRSLADFGLPEAQTLEDLEALLDLARQLGMQVVFSVAKIVQPRRVSMAPAMVAMRAVYAACAAPARLVFRSGSWRFPDALADEHIVQPFLNLCERTGVSATHCMRNLLETH
jgi:hypothetical protein